MSTTPLALQVAIPIALGVLAVGAGIAVAAYVTAQANAANARITAACNVLSTVAGTDVIAAGPLTTAVTAIGATASSGLSSAQAMTINNWINGITNNLNAVRTAANTNACPT